MGRIWPILLLLLALYMEGQEAPLGWPGGAGSWSLSGSVLLLIAVFGLLSLSSAFLQSSLVRFVYLLNRNWERANRAYFLLMRPGVLVHELSHAIAAMLVGGKVTSFNVLETKVVGTGNSAQVRLGHVAYVVPGRANGIGWRLKDAFVGSAPLLVGVLLVALLLALAGVDWTPGLVPALQNAAGDWRAWLAMIAIVEIADSMTPSSADRKNWPAAAIVLLLLAALLLLLTTIALEQGWTPPADLASSPTSALALLALVLTVPVVINLVIGGLLRLMFEIFFRR